LPITIKCPECGDKRSVPDEFAGKKLKCKSCDAVFRASAPPAPPLVPPAKRRDEEDAEIDEKPRSRRRDDDDDDEQEEKPRSRRRDDDDEVQDEKPRSRRRGEEDDEKPRSRRSDNDEPDDRPRRRKSADRERGKQKKKKVTIGYILGVIAASLFLLGALGFVAWRAGLFQGKSDDKTKVEDEKEPEYLAPDPRIGANRKESIGPDGERVAGVERIRLAIDVSEAAPNSHTVVISYQVLSGAGLGANDRLVVKQDSRVVVYKAMPETDKSDPKRGTFTFTLTDDARRNFKKLWIAIVPANSQDALKDGVRVSNVVAMP